METSPFYFNCVMVNYTYNAWGVVSSSVNSNLTGDLLTAANGLLVHNPYVYKGYYYDSDTGYYYLKSRYYDPRIHRFLSAADTNNMSITSLYGLNLYVYGCENPISASVNDRGIRRSAFSSGIGYGLAGLTPAKETQWHTSWYNDEGKWNNWTGSLFKAQYGNFSLDVGVIYLGLFNVTNSGIEFINLQADILKAEYKFTDWLGVHGTLGTVAAYAGLDFEKGIGVELRAVAVTGGINLGFISFEGYAGGVGFTYMYKDGRLNFGLIDGVGAGVSIDVVGYLEWRYKPYIELYKWISSLF